MDEPTNDEISSIRGRAPGESQRNPYEDVDVSDLPEWWREAIEEFDRYQLRPYQPPRFVDGVMKHEVVERLEADLDVEIKLIRYSVESQDEWQIEVNGRPIGSIGHYRSPEGYSVFEMEGEEFDDLVRSHASSDGNESGEG